LFGGVGISVGRTAWTNQRFYGDGVDDATSIHESFHYLQQKQMGFGNFYGRTAIEYIRGLFRPGNFYDNVYRNPSTLEYQAEQVEEAFRTCSSSRNARFFDHDYRDFNAYWIE